VARASVVRLPRPVVTLVEPISDKSAWTAGAQFDRYTNMNQTQPYAQRTEVSELAGYLQTLTELD
jgi:hypothetical protein